MEELTFTRQLDCRTGFNELYLVEDDPSLHPQLAAAPIESQLSTNCPATSRPIVSNIPLWSYIIGDDMVGLPVSAPAYSLWAYIAGADRVPGCRPAAKSVGVLGYIIGEDRLRE